MTETPNATRTLASQSYAADTALEIVERWHDDVHPGVFRFCDEQPCHALGLASTEGRYQRLRRDVR